MSTEKEKAREPTNIERAIAADRAQRAAARRVFHVEVQSPSGDWIRRPGEYEAAFSAAEAARAVSRVMISVGTFVRGGGIIYLDGRTVDTLVAP